MKKIKIKEYISNNSKKIIIITSSIAILATSSALLIQNTANLGDIAYSGVLIESEDIGSISREELTKKLTDILETKFNSKKITFVYEDKLIEASPLDLGVSYNIDAIVDEAISYGKTGNALNDTLNRLSLFFSPQKINYSTIINSEMLDSYIQHINNEFNVPATNAQPIFNEDSITLTESKTGLSINNQVLKDLICEAIQDNFNSPIPITVPMEITQPKLDSSIQDKLVPLGSHYTKLPSLQGVRTKNIKLFSSKLNGSILAPGEEFSADKTAGRREVRDGYGSAPVFENGQVVNATAGGICQVTTTLYNALLYSDMEITKRAPHSMVVTYMQKGLDSAIAKGYKDLKFKNNTSNPVIVQTYVTPSGYVKATIWGVQENPQKTIKLRTINHGPKSATAYKDTYENGVLIKSEFLSKDSYK